ncbi:MAG: Uma2 family endonuclease [Treponema sp.]|jgi:Uma2 family endonuclease|nr:Uma2 family endonuclease [Treponema sp.]
MSTAALENDYYTCADVYSWDEDFRAEIIDGIIYEMAPPSTAHQDISRELFVYLCNYLKGKTCKAYAAPFGVRLFPRKDLSDDTLVEPDIVVVCDPSKIDEKGCNGAPDLIIEILSPSTSRKDKKIKFQVYQRAGVKEYWIVDPESRIVQVHILDNGNYITTVYDEDDEVKVSVLDECVVALKEVFPALTGE